ATGVVAQVSLPGTLANVVAPGATISGGGNTAYTLSYNSLTSLAAGASQAYSLSYTAPTTGSTQASASITTTAAESYLTNNPSTITTATGAYADVTTSITGPASVNPGLATSEFTVNFTNNGPSTAAGITQSVTLPTGASISAAQLTALQNKYSSSVVTIAYNATTRVLSFTPTTGNNTLASGAANSYSFPLTASATPGSVAISSSVGTTSAQGTPSDASTGTLPDAASYSFAVAPLADMVALLTNNNAPTVTVGGTGTFVATFTNNGPSVAENVVPTVQLPAGLTNVTFPSGLSGTYNASTGLVTYASTATLAAGSNLTSTISFTMPASQVAATASINTTTNEGSNTANNTVRAAIANASNFDVTTFITGPASAAPGTSVTLSVITQNLGPGTAPSTTQTVVIPGVFTDLYVSNGGTYANNGTSTTVTFPAVTGLASGANANNSITLTMPTANLNNISATVTAAGETSSAANTRTTSVATATASTSTVNLYTTIAAATADAPTTPLSGLVTPGTTLLLSITTGNYGPNAAANAVTQVALPVGLSGVVASGEGTYDATTGLVTFPTVASLAQGGTVSYTIQLPAPASGPLVPVVSITSPSPETVIADNVASTKVEVLLLADMTTSLSGPSAPTVGQPATYAVTTTNNGPTNAVSVVQTLSLPVGLSAVTVTNAAGTALSLPPGAYNSATGLLTLPASAVATNQIAGASVLNYVTFTTPPSTGFPVMAAVTTTSQETNATNNSASVVTTPAPTADISVTLAGPASALQGNLVSYVVATVNNGPSVDPSSTTTVQLPTGLTNVQVSGGGSYNSSTGVVSFPAITDQAVGAAGAVNNTIAFVAPATTPLTVTAQVAVAPAGNDPNLNNNSATVNTTVAPSSTSLVDESTTITATVGNSAASTTNPATAGGSVTFNVTATNASTSAAAASGVALRVQLPAGLNQTDVSVSNGSYDPATGVVSFGSLTSQAIGASSSFSVVISNVPGGSTALTATSLVSTTNSDSNPNNNTYAVTVPVTPRADITTTIAGPSTVTPSSSATYLVTTRNVGPSPANAVNTTVQLPAGLSGVVVSSGGSYNPTTGVVTFPTIATLPGYSGTATASISAQQMEYTITLTAPSTITSSAGYTVTSTVTTATAEPPTNTVQAVNTANLTTTAANQPPVASNVVNTLQAPEANTGQQLVISPLTATDSDGSVSTYSLTSLPTSGKLYYNNSGTYTEIVADNLLTGNSPLYLTPTQAQTLKYTPVTGFVGNAFFGYLATDNGAVPLNSNRALYTIAVGADNASVYAKTPVKSSTSAYAAGDIIAFVTDNNGALYNTSSLVYNASTGALQDQAANGVATATSNGTFTSSQYSSITTLSQLGLVLDGTTGQLKVQTPANLRAGSYTLNITTTDLYGGTTTQPVSFTIGGTPLPVVLTDFTAQAVQNRDARLNWATASEKNNDHFEVERSFDGTSFVQIGQVAGHGTLATASAYTLTDAGVAAKATGPVYYRLRQVDLDGTATYSPVRTVRFADAAPAVLTLYPNPAQASTTLDLSQLPTTGTYQVLLLDATGRTVQSAALGGGLPQPLDVHELATGLYQVLVTGQQANGAPLRQVLRLTKE
ncbi:MAG: T9SS type A sorting domain-containing protein, partial [Hymenobacter sp.]